MAPTRGEMTAVIICDQGMNLLPFSDDRSNLVKKYRDYIGEVARWRSKTKSGRHLGNALFITEDRFFARHTRPWLVLGMPEFIYCWSHHASCHIELGPYCRTIYQIPGNLKEIRGLNANDTRFPLVSRTYVLDGQLENPGTSLANSVISQKYCTEIHIFQLVSSRGPPGVPCTDSLYTEFIETSRSETLRDAKTGTYFVECVRTRVSSATIAFAALLLYKDKKIRAKQGLLPHKENTSLKWVLFFHIVMRLPTELQMRICNIACGINRDFVKQEEYEPYIKDWEASL